jgi:hypothetical protein
MNESTGGDFSVYRRSDCCLRKNQTPFMEGSADNFVSNMISYQKDPLAKGRVLIDISPIQV